MTHDDRAPGILGPGKLRQIEEAGLVVLDARVLEAASAQLKAASVALDALVLSVAQATVELASERHTHMHTVWHNREEIARDVLRQAVGCSRDDPDSEYAKVLEAMGVRDG